MILKVGSKGTVVITLQKLLVLQGFNISVDGLFGKRTEEAVKIFQERNDIKPIDGICGNLTYQALVNSSKKLALNYKEKIVWINPKDLKGTLVKATSASISSKYKNFINGAYFWYIENVGNRIIGWFYSEGRSINYSNYNRYRGTFIVLKDGTVISKRMNDSEIMTIRNDIWFAVQGFDGINANPYVEGFSTEEVGRKCFRSILGYNPKINKVLVCVFNGDYKDVERVLKKYNCTVGIALDGGGSTNMYLDGKAKYKTSRVLNNIIYW